MSGPNMPGNQESLYVAKMLIEEHGSAAARHARSNANRLMRIRDFDGSDSWTRIAWAVDFLLDPHSPGTIHSGG